MKTLLYTSFIALSLAAATACGDKNVAETEAGVTEVPVGTTSVMDLMNDSIGDWGVARGEAPERGVRLETHWPGGSYAEVFNDSNYVHWASAEKIGIEPITSTRSHWATRRPLVKITPCSYYYVDTLTYSKPYMVPEGAALLRELGRRFHDSLQARGGGDYRFKVTSVTRTADNVRRLRRVNRNAVDSSVHQMGTTVDISWARFVRDSPSTIDRGTDDLKALLAEILLAMRNEGKCWVKYEQKQPCFHITARGKGE